MVQQSHREDNWSRASNWRFDHSYFIRSLVTFSSWGPQGHTGYPVCVHASHGSDKTPVNNVECRRVKGRENVWTSLRTPIVGAKHAFPNKTSSFVATVLFADSYPFKPCITLSLTKTFKIAFTTLSSLPDGSHLLAFAKTIPTRRSGSETYCPHPSPRLSSVASPGTKRSRVNWPSSNVGTFDPNEAQRDNGGSEKGRCR